MPIKNKSQNINSLWADLIVEELRRCGVEYFCVAPGSRSAPLAVAVSNNPRIKSIVHYDERGLGFHALGLTSANLKPTVIITTSGSAVANLFPSVIEASKKKLPLIILSADRPPELRATGANQTIDQVQIFGDYVRFFFDLPCPDKEIAPEMVLTTIDQLVSRAKGELPGPVHLNCMFREPLAPHQETTNLRTYLKSIHAWEKSNSPYTLYPKPQFTLSRESIEQAAESIRSIKNGIIAVGKISGRKEEEAVLKLAAKLNWPVFADVTSGLRLGRREKNIIHHFDHILTLKNIDKKLRLDGVLHLGGRLTSNRWLKFAKALQLKHYIMVLKHPLRNDPQHMVTLRLQGRVHEFCEKITDQIPSRKGSIILKNLQRADRICTEICETSITQSQADLTEPAITNLLTKMLPPDSGLFIGNSMPVRELNLFSSTKGHPVKITANRGASGIDGNIATASGFAKANDITCTALIGDLTFLHDLNSLTFLRDNKKPFVLIVINNEGGAIFSFLPIAQFKKGFEKFFTVPQHMNFHSAAQMFGIEYRCAKTPAEFVTAYTASIRHPGTTILELHSDKSKTLKNHADILAKISNLLSKSRFS